jgi:UDP-N-acetylglucosamine 2-epimerase (non-hydrolysing)
MTRAGLKYRVLCVAGARPNMMKVAPLIRALRATGVVDCQFVHTGQHFDRLMRDDLIKELELPAPDVMLDIGSGGHVEQLAKLLLELAPTFRMLNPDIVVVVGDVNSTLGAALTAAKMRIPIAHVEAGLRSFDRSMPEETNRILTDQLADLLFATEQDAMDNLKREGIDDGRIRLVGNVMADALLAILPHAPSPDHILARAGASAGWRESMASVGYAFATLHRPSNVDEVDNLRDRLNMLADVAGRIPLIFAIHPRTRKAVNRHGLAWLLEHPRILALDSLPYATTIGLLRGARLVLTDSGGIQEETTVLGVPCLTVRENTERPVTVTFGTNEVVGVDKMQVLTAVNKVLVGPVRKGQIPHLWDGHAAERIASALVDWVGAGPENASSL